MITLPYNLANFAFTLDDVFIAISTTTANTYFTLTLTIKYYNFYNSTLQTKTIDYKIPLFNQAQEINIGRVIHRTMANIIDINNLVPQYKTALVDLTFKELNIADDTLVAQTDYTNLKFIAGPLPKVEMNKAILSLNNYACRVSPTGFINISILIPTGDQIIEIYKNNTLLSSHTLTGTATDNVFTEKIDLKVLGAVQGDVFRYRLKDTNLFKDIIVFPETNLSHQLLYVDEFKLLSTLECTGEFNFNTKFDKTTHNYKRKLADVLEIVDIEKTDTFKIDTGWILKSDNITIESLLNSKKAWLFISANEVIEMIPTNSKVSRVDSAQDLYSELLEFKINKAYDAQNYTL